MIFIPRVTYEQAAKEFADHGYTLIDNDVMATKKMAYTCNKHPDKPPQYIDLSHLRRGHGCKYCREGRRSNHSVNKDTVIKLCEDRAFEFVNLRSDGIKSIIDFICEKHQDKGVQSMDLQTLRKCHGCRYCAGKGRTTESFIKELNNPNIEILGEYTYANSHIKCRCEIDGTIWKSTPNRLLSGQGCPECGRIIANLHSTKSNEDFLEELANKKPTIRPLGKYIGVFIPIKFECLVCGHKWDMTPDSALHTDRVCPKCTKKRNLERMTKTNAQFLEELSMVNPYLQPLEPYKTDHEKIKVLCKKHSFIWYVAPNKILHKRTGCPRCAAYNNERKASFILESWGYNIQMQKRFNDCKDKNPLPFDIYLPDYNIAIEYDGEQHYWPVIRRGMKSNQDAVNSYEVTVRHDAIKTEYCKTHGISLIRIPYWEADNMESFLFDEMVRCGAIEEIITA